HSSGPDDLGAGDGESTRSSIQPRRAPGPGIPWERHAILVPAGVAREPQCRRALRFHLRRRGQLRVCAESEWRPLRRCAVGPRRLLPHGPALVLRAGTRGGRDGGGLVAHCLHADVSTDLRTARPPRALAQRMDPFDAQLTRYTTRILGLAYQRG